jgi:hypothetical protein
VSAGTTSPPAGSAAVAGLRRRLRRPGPRAEAALAFAFYLAFAIWMTWPVAADLESRLYGGIGDLTGAISTFRELVEGRHVPFLPGSVEDFAAPDGQQIRWTLNVAAWASTSVWMLLTAVLGPLVAANVYVLAGFAVTGLATFLLVRRLTGSSGAALVCGFAYAFFPFVVVKAGGHVDFIHGWVLVVLLWRAIELVQRPTLRNGLWVGLAFVLAASWTPYHILFGGAILIGAAAAGLLAGRSPRVAQLRGFALAGAVSLVWLFGVLAIATLADAPNPIREHSIDAAYTYSSRALEFVVPADRHPVVGAEAGRWRAEHLHGSNQSESTLYVGIVVLLLALAGFVVALRRGGTWRLLGLLGAGVALAAFVLSAPPKVNVLGVAVTTPSGAIWEITSTWRVFARLVVVVELGLVLLAGLALAALLRRLRPGPAAAVTAVALVLVAADLRTAPEDGTNKIVAPRVYTDLAKRPAGLAAEYPLLPAEQSQSGDVFYQGWHDKPLVNGYLPGSGQENRALALTDLANPRTAEGLAALGVRWIMVRQDIEAAGLPDPGRPTPASAYRLLARDDYLALYELRVTGRPVLASPWTGFHPPDRAPDGATATWLREPRGELEVRGRGCTPCSGTLRMDVGSLGGEPRTVTITAPGGRVLARERTTGGRIEVPLRFSGRVRLGIAATPGPKPISAVLAPSADPRSVSVSVDRLRFIPGRAAR